jgi:hypothetical protein
MGGQQVILVGLSTEFSNLLAMVRHGQILKHVILGGVLKCGVK